MSNVEVAEAMTPKNELGDLKKSIGGINITQVDEQSPYINALFYGDPGVGKTILAASAEDVIEMLPALVIDVEGGTFSLREKYSGIDVVRVKRWTDIQSVYGALFDQAKKGKLEYKTIILDSLSEIQKFSMEQIMVEVVRENPDRDRDVPSMREWGINLEQIRRLVRAFRDLPINCIFTALSKTEKDDRSGTMFTKPSLSGKMGNEVAGFVDLVAYMYTKIKDGQIQRFLLTQPTDRQMAKDRSGKLPLVVESPTMQIIHDYMFAEIRPAGLKEVTLTDAPTGTTDLSSLLDANDTKVSDKETQTQTKDKEK